MQHYHLNEAGVKINKCVICIFGHTHPDITYAPLLYAICGIFLHYMDESQTYNSMCALLQSKHMYITQTKLMYETSKYVLKDLLKKHIVSNYFLMKM